MPSRDGVLGRTCMGDASGLFSSTEDSIVNARRGEHADPQGAAVGPGPAVCRSPDGTKAMYQREPTVVEPGGRTSTHGFRATTERLRQSFPRSEGVTGCDVTLSPTFRV